VYLDSPIVYKTQNKEKRMPSYFLAELIGGFVVGMAIGGLLIYFFFILPERKWRSQQEDTSASRKALERAGEEGRDVMPSLEEAIRSLDRKARRRWDTENNIGHRFYNIVEEYCLPKRFVVEDYHAATGGYHLAVWRGGGIKKVVLFITIDLSCPAERQIIGNFGDLSENFCFASDRESIERATLYIREHLTTL